MLEKRLAGEMLVAGVLHPAGDTRNFPTFFTALNADFLAQGAIWSRFAEAFGRENIITRAYGDIRQAHIEAS